MSEWPIGGTVWAVIAGATLLWLAVTTRWRDRLPSVVAVFRSFLRSRLGRCLLFAGWAELGWHFFCQRP